MIVINYNINDFGGCSNHIEEFKNIYGKSAYKEWDAIDKTRTIEGVLSLIEEKKPDVIVFQECDLKSVEVSGENGFNKRMKALGYYILHEKTSYRRPSLTVMFVKDSLNVKNSHVSTGHERNGRAYAIEIGDVVIYGTHVPPKGDNEQFWNEMSDFIRGVKKNNKELILVGDYNTINYNNLKHMRRMKENDGVIDIWADVYKKEEPLSVQGDYVFASYSIANRMGVEKKDLQYSDHPAIIVDLNY